MILRMPRPWRHPTTAQLYNRARLPADVGKHFAGRTITVEVGGQTTRVKLNSHIKVSLRTKHAAEARPRHASVQSQLEQCWAAERNGAVSLSHKEIMALAGLWYRQMVADHEDDPGDAADWEVYQGLLADGLAYLDPDSDGVSSEPYSPRDGIRLLIRHGVHIEPVLEARGLKVDEATRLKLIEQVAISLCMAAETLIRRASGDYGPDRYVERYPVWTRSKPASCNTQGGPTLMQLFSGWAKEGRPAQSTFDQWRSYVASFQEFVGQDRASEIGRQHIRGWKDHLLDLGNSAKTINGSKLAALGAIFSWGVENDLVALDPTKGIKVKQKRKAGQRMLGFEKTEAAVILRASAKASSPVFRWVPLLCAQSGARVSEVCQLRGVDIRREDGIWVMAFRAEAGSLKTQGSERRVPLHPHVLEAGFLDFVSSKGTGPLFYDPGRRKLDAKRPQAKIVAKKVARWVHTLGIEVGRQHRKDPNHAWRHLFRTLGRDIGESEVSLAITGHAFSSVGQRYGEVTLATMRKVVARIPLPGVADKQG